MLVSRHEDRPGAIGLVGQTLGEADVNISAMHLGRSDRRSIAFMILALDEPVPAEAAQRIRAYDAMLDVWLISLDALETGAADAGSRPRPQAQSQQR
jgi:D-3-phosphoglycerate dehydrogenase